MQKPPRTKNPLHLTLTLLTAIATTAGSLHMAKAQNSDDADFKTEERFHKIYKTYNEQPTSNEAWEKALANRKANTYPIQKNDTLWDVSNTFFGDSNYWPKIWSYNTDNILNPHEISPKNVIKFYPGTLAEAPTIGLADAKAAPEAMPSKIIEKTPGGNIEGITIPPPKHQSRPLVKHLPNSLPLYRLGRVNAPPVQFESESLIKKIPTPIKDLARYVTDKPVPSIGEVVEAELTAGETAAEFQFIVVRLNETANKQLIAFKDETQVSDPFNPSADKGTVVQIQGEIQVIEKVSDSENLYRAQVKKVLDPIEVGAKLAVGKIQTFNAEKTALTSSTQARIIGGENHRYIQDLFSEDTIVFLNSGQKEGLTLNSTLPIFRSEKLRHPDTYATMNDRIVGKIKIVKLADHFATGYVVSTSSELLIGDYVGGRLGSTVSTSAPANPDDAVELTEDPTKEDTLKPDDVIPSESTDEGDGLQL